MAKAKKESPAGPATREVTLRIDPAKARAYAFVMEKLLHEDQEFVEGDGAVLADAIHMLQNLAARAERKGRDCPEISNENEIQLYHNCALCLAELPDGMSPKEWARTQAGWTKRGLQVWCVRHEVNIMSIDFEGIKHPANTTRKGPPDPGLRERAINRVREVNGMPPLDMPN